MKRREFLKTSATIASIPSASILTSTLGISRYGLAQNISQIKQVQQAGTFIVVFLRGGADGLGILSPLNDPNFKQARNPQISFEASNNSFQHQGHTFYWHPSASPLAQLMQEGRMVPWLAVGINNETRSHFEAQEMMERGLSQLGSLPDGQGFMARIASENKSSSSFIFAGSSQVPRALRGNVPAIAIRDLQNGVGFPGGENILKAILNQVHNDASHPLANSMEVTLESLNQIQQTLANQNGKVSAYESAGQTRYPNNDPGVGLRSIARLLRANIPLQYAWVDQGGWDMHEGQPGRLRNILDNLSNALLAFDQDQKAQNKKYTLVVLTEFGRRLRSNASNGTDHGHASLSMVLGSNIPAGKVMGNWPGLSESQLDRGVDLAVTSSYQEVINQALQWGRFT